MQPCRLTGGVKREQGDLAAAETAYREAVLMIEAARPMRPAGDRSRISTGVRWLTRFPRPKAPRKLLRELTAVTETGTADDVIWARQAIDALLELKKATGAARAAGHDVIDAEVLEKHGRWFRDAADAGVVLNAARRSKLQKKRHALAKRMRDRAGDYLRFAHELRVPFNALAAPVEAACRELAEADTAAAAIPAGIPLGELAPDVVRLDAETKQITNAIRMAAYNAETTLARALDGHYARAGHEAYALIREALTVSGDVIPGHGELLVRLDPLTAPRHTQALATFCDQLTTVGACYPGTGLVLHYEVKSHPNPA